MDEENKKVIKKKIRHLEKKTDAERHEERRAKDLRALKKKQKVLTHDKEDKERIINVR